MSKSERRQRTDIVALRVLPGEQAALEAAAAARGITVAQLVRHALSSIIEPTPLTVAGRADRSASVHSQPAGSDAGESDYLPLAKVCG